MNEIALSNSLNQIELEIKYHKNIAGQSIWEIGRRLSHVKENDLAHGEFGKWLNRIEMSHTQANRFMKVYQEFEKSELTHMGQFGIRALYEIATLPEEEREKEHTLKSGETKTVDEMVVREIEEVRRKLNGKERIIKQQEKTIREKEKEVEDLKNKEPKVIKEPFIPEDYQELEKSEKQLRAENRHLSEETQRLKQRLDKIENDSAEVEHLQQTIKQLDQKKSKITNILDANDRLAELEEKFHKFFDVNMAPLKYKPLVNELSNFNGTKRMKELVNLTRAWVDDMDRMLPSDNRKIIEGEIIDV